MHSGGRELGESRDATTLEDALALLGSLGEVYCASGVVYLHPGFVTALLKPLVDHRLGKDHFRARARQYCAQLQLEPHQMAARMELLLDAVTCLSSSGELREELLPLAWAQTGLAPANYRAVLQMLCSAGVLILIEEAEQGRRWVMPIRLPAEPSSRVGDLWTSTLPVASQVELSAEYALGHFMPPGLIERLIAACSTLGAYRHHWQRGALIEESTASLLLLVVLRSEAAAPSSMGEHHSLRLAVRGAAHQRPALWLLLKQAWKLAEALLEEFPGVAVDARLRCPACSGQSNDPAVADTLMAEAVRRNQMDCAACGACVRFLLVESAGSPRSSAGAAPDLLPAGSSGSMPLSAGNSGGGSGSGVSESDRFVAKPLIFGRPVEAAVGVHALLGIDEDDLYQLKRRGEAAIAEEMAAFNSQERDASGWSDLDWLNYMRDQPAVERPLPAGMPSSVLDRGHAGMTLDDFVRKAPASAKLSRAECLALRLYTCSVYRTINDKLRSVCTPEQPHPYPALVANLVLALKKLRTAQAGQDGTRELWRGSRDFDVTDEFLKRGGTEVRAQSTNPPVRHILVVLHLSYPRPFFHQC